MMIVLIVQVDCNDCASGVNVYNGRVFIKNGRSKNTLTVTPPSVQPPPNSSQTKETPKSSNIIFQLRTFTFVNNIFHHKQVQDEVSEEKNFGIKCTGFYLFFFNFLILSIFWFTSKKDFGSFF